MFARVTRIGRLREVAHVVDRSRQEINHPRVTSAEITLKLEEVEAKCGICGLRFPCNFEVSWCVYLLFALQPVALASCAVHIGHTLSNIERFRQQALTCVNFFCAGELLKHRRAREQSKKHTNATLRPPCCLPRPYTLMGKGCLDGTSDPQISPGQREQPNMSRLLRMRFEHQSTLC